VNDHEVFDLGDAVLQEGATLRDAKLAYKTYGRLNDEKSNAIVYPTWYSGRHWENEWLIGEGMALDPNDYFIIVPNMLGNGLSSSPSNTPPPYDKARFPRVTLYDNVSVQHKLVTEHFGIERLVLVTGWSMGAQQTYQWAVSHPEMVTRILTFCGSSRTSPHNNRVPGGGESGADGGRGLEARLVRRAADEGVALHGPGVRRVGLLPGLLLERMLPRGRLLLPGGLPRRLLGGVLPGGMSPKIQNNPS
jgi:pimeloyl-ACP methyl ester carboxylesterase